MRHYRDYKKLFLKTLIVIFLFSFYFLTLAQTAEEVKNKIDQKNTEIADLERQIKEFQNNLTSLGKQKQTLSTILKELDLTRKKLNADITLTTTKIDKTNLKISTLSTEITDKETKISTNAGALVLDIKRMNELEKDSLVKNLIEHKNLSELWNDIDNMSTLRETILSHTNVLKETKGNLETDREATISAKDELVALKSELADQRKIVEQNANQKNKLLKETKNNEANYQKIIKEKNAKKTALEQDLRDYESQLKFILDPKSLPGGGVLSWPLDDVYVTQLFGKTVAAKRLYASGSHSGVDFRASVGTPIKSMGNGVVKGTGDTDLTCPGASFGKWVFIEYDNGLSSTFGHLSLIKAYEGQKVSRGDIVAYSGATGHVTGPHLHVTVYAGGAASVKTVPSKSCEGKTLTQPLAATNGYLDPMYYLPPYKN